MSNAEYDARLRSMERSWHAEVLWKKDMEIDRLRALVAELTEATKDMLRAFDPDAPGACPQECFDTSDGHGAEVQEAAIERARASLAKSQGHPPHGPGMTGV
jgi:hypothetical protein